MYIFRKLLRRGLRTSEKLVYLRCIDRGLANTSKFSGPSGLVGVAGVAAAAWLESPVAAAVAAASLEFSAAGVAAFLSSLRLHDISF